MKRDLLAHYEYDYNDHRLNYSIHMRVTFKVGLKAKKGNYICLEIVVAIFNNILLSRWIMFSQ